MEIGHSPETIQHEEKTNQGFSEKRAARVIEGKNTDKKRKPMVLPMRHAVVAMQKQASQKEKLIAAHEKNAKMLIDLIKTLGLLAKGSLRQEENLMEEIRKRQKVQDELLNALILENRGELKEETLSQDVRDLIQ